MAEFDAYTTVQEAATALAKGGVSSATEDGQSVQYYSLKDLLDADDRIKAKSANDVFGLRMKKCVPPSTG